ncbi:MAG: SRPBCC domain-containing protein [Pirellulales bacterium]|nr:SRPBCC domain-containing protein [Pirellulales bacterium]
MAESTTDSPPKLVLHRTLRAPRERVFRAWTDPQQLSQWFAPAPDMDHPIMEVDFRVGGRYRIGMQRPGAPLYIVAGEYREISPPRRLVFTWQWQNEGSLRDETLVTVELLDHDGGTRLVLTHELLPTEIDRTKHGEGWTGCLDRLERFLPSLC